MLSGYNTWIKFDPLLSFEEYNCIEEKLRHILSYIGGYADPHSFDTQVLFENLELDATTSYFSTQNCSDRLTPWLMHESLTFEVRSCEITEDVRTSMSTLLQFRQSSQIAEDVAELSTQLIHCISSVRRAQSGSDALTLLFAIDVCLLLILGRINSERLSYFLRK